MAISKNKLRKFAVSLTSFFYMGSIVASAAAMTIWSKEFRFNEYWVAILGAIGTNAFGAAVGALIGGFLIDKFGISILYKYNMLIYSAGILLCACAINLWMLVVGIIISGISVGASVPASWTYLSQSSKSSNRAANIGIAQFSWSLAPAIIYAASVILSIFAPGMLGIRILYGAIFIAAIIAWNMQRKLREKKEFVEKQNKIKKNLKAEPIHLTMLNALKNPINIKTILFLVAVYLTWNIVAGTMGQFMPYIFSAVGHLDQIEISILHTIMWALSALSALIIFGRFADIIPHRLMYFITSLMGILAWIIMVFLGIQIKAGTAGRWSWLVWVFVVLWGLAHGSSAQTFYALWSSELFPKKYRGGVQGIMFFLVRATLGFWSLFIITQLGADSALGLANSGIIMIGFLLISGIVGIIWCPKTQGKSLDKIIMERYGTLD